MRTVALTPHKGPGSVPLSAEHHPSVLGSAGAWRPSSNPRVRPRQERVAKSQSVALTPVSKDPARYQQVQDLREKLRQIQDSQTKVLNKASKLQATPQRVRVETSRDSSGNVTSIRTNARPESASRIKHSKLTVPRTTVVADSLRISNSPSSLSARLPLRVKSDAQSRRAPAWVPAGAMYQPQMSVSWNRPPPPRESLARSSSPFLKLADLPQPMNVVTRDGEFQVDPDEASSSSFWTVKHGQANFAKLNPDGKFDIKGRTQVTYVDRLSGPQLIRFMFCARPPSSSINTSILAASGEVDVPGYRAWSLSILANGRLRITWSTCDKRSTDRGKPWGERSEVLSSNEHVELGRVTVGEWHVAQLVVAAGQSGADFAVDIWAIPGQDRSQTAVVPAIGGRQLKGCKRLFWHHVRLLSSALASPQLLDAHGNARSRGWQLHVLSNSGLMELDMWRIERVYVRERGGDSTGQQAAGAPLTQGRGGVMWRAAQKNVWGRGSGRGKEDGVECVAEEMRELAEEQAMGRELDANAIANSWGVDKVVALLDQFRAEFGEAKTEEYKQVLRAERIDGAALLGLTLADLQSIGIEADEDRPHAQLLLKEIESHLLSCGNRYKNFSAMASRAASSDEAHARARAGSTDGHAHAGIASQGDTIDAVRALLESLGGEIGDARAADYYRQLVGHNVRTHGDLLALSDDKLRACGISALSHRKMLLARVETLKLLPDPHDTLAEWLQGGRFQRAMHPLLTQFPMHGGPPLSSVPALSQEFAEVEQLFWEWAANPKASDPAGGCKVTIDSIQRTVLAKRQLEHFGAARARLRNPFAPLFRLMLSGLDRQELLQACSADGPQLPQKPGEFGKGLDFIGALRPVCRQPWAFPPGTHTLLVCDVAVGIPWRVPEGVEVCGEWDGDDAGSGVSTSRLTDWSYSKTGCDLLSRQGWLRMTTGGRAEAGELVKSDSVLCFSFRISSEGQQGGTLRAFCGMERGEWGSAAFARFGLALRAVRGGGEARGACAMELVRRGRSIQRYASVKEHPDDLAGPGHLNRESETEEGDVDLGIVEEGLWYSVELRVSTPHGLIKTGIKCMRVDVFAGRGAGPAGEVSSQAQARSAGIASASAADHPAGIGGSTVGKDANACICSHQSMVDGDEDGNQDEIMSGWTPALHVDRGGIVEFDDWVLRTERTGPPQIPVPTGATPPPKADGDKVQVSLEKVRNAGYDSIFIPRTVTGLLQDKVEVFRHKLSTMTRSQASSIAAEASLQQLAFQLSSTLSPHQRPASLAPDTTARSSAAGAGGGGGGQGGFSSGGVSASGGSGRCVLRGGASMGCGCGKCQSDMEASRQVHQTWEDKDDKVFQMLPADVQKQYNPKTVAHYDQYVVYNPHQALPRYVISFTVADAPPDEASVEPCWMCSEAPDRITPAQTCVVLNLTNEPVPLCFACAASTSVPAAPEIVAPASDTVVDARGQRALVLEWTEPTCPAPIDMYLMQVAALPEGSEDPDDADSWRDLLQDFALRTLIISPADPKRQEDDGDKTGSSLPPGPYCFRVRARSAAGWGAWSKQVYRRIPRFVSGKQRRKARSSRQTMVLGDVDVWAAPMCYLSAHPISTRIRSASSDEEEQEDQEEQEEEQDGGFEPFGMAQGRIKRHLKGVAQPLVSGEGVVPYTQGHQGIQEGLRGNHGHVASEEAAAGAAALEQACRPVGTLSADACVQYCAAWHPIDKNMWIKPNVTSSEVLLLCARGRLRGSVFLPCPAMSLCFSGDGKSLYLGSGLDYFAKLDIMAQDGADILTADLQLVWKVSHSDGPCARGVAAERRKDKHGAAGAELVYAAFNTGPILELQGATGAKLRVIVVRPALHMALGLVLVCPGVLAVSDSGRVLLVRVSDGSMLGQVAAGYLNAAIAFDGSRLLCAPANSKVWHVFKLPPPFDSKGQILAL